jgi:hypothetical protein
MDVKHGMTKRQVRELLGRPHDKNSSRSILRDMRRGGTHVVSLGPVRNHQYWTYTNVPPGCNTIIQFERGRVSEVQTRPSSGA